MGNWKSRERETGRERKRETEICAKLPGQRQLAALGYCLHESQGRVGLRTHGSLILFMSRTRNNCGGEDIPGAVSEQRSLVHFPFPVPCFSSCPEDLVACLSESR